MPRPVVIRIRNSTNSYNSYNSNPIGQTQFYLNPSTRDFINTTLTMINLGPLSNIISKTRSSPTTKRMMTIRIAIEISRI